ncbi:hypothetical protein H6G89_26125 [Oscillatoria sp. FACHB-1407]|uniref:hypothetical protein n=1 Tax=Oscillatoria sp. FACHB-1407 TaxID=2692847 RepID=UPI001689B633|nr:hypothetical protein [Oscillatoria sp. FACHB-1407]MBD2464488.1 hypothetical protein [Oscillatoria sp. FACHB-1407]
MNRFPPKTYQQPTLETQGDRKTLAVLMVQLEEVEEQMDSLQQSRADLLKKIAELL